ncbi:MAG: protease modulator HflC [bacterium]
MKENKLPVLIIAVFLLVSGLNLVFYIVNERQQVVVTRLGKPVRVVKEAGLYLRTPFVEQINYFDKRYLDYDSLPTELYTKDKQTLVIDNFCRWRITDPLLFLQAVHNEAGAQSRLDDIVYSELREKIKHRLLTEVVNSINSNLMKQITLASNEKTGKFGVEVIDVQIKSLNLPPENKKHLFEEMRAERERKAKKFRSEGEEEATKIRADTDEEKAAILATAYKKAEIVIGAADAEATKIYAAAYNKDPEFYSFLRTLKTYRNTMKKKSTAILTPDTELMKYFQGEKSR